MDEIKKSGYNDQVEETGRGKGMESYLYPIRLSKSGRNKERDEEEGLVLIREEGLDLWRQRRVARSRISWTNLLGDPPPGVVCHERRLFNKSSEG